MSINIITLFTETFIDSCHRLHGYNGKCSNLHGHSWVVKVWIQGFDHQKDEVGILFDFGKIKNIKEKLDHKMINEEINILSSEKDIWGFKEEDTIGEINPTAENISLWILLELTRENPNLNYRIRVYETAVGKETYSQRQTEGFDIRYL